MRKYTNFLYYSIGVFCLAFSALLLFNSSFLSPQSLSNRIIHEKIDRGYRDFYVSSLPLHMNDLRQGAVFVPIYSLTDDDELNSILNSFKMQNARLTCEDEYCHAVTQDGRSLKIYRFLNLLEYENLSAGNGILLGLRDIGNIEAKDIAAAFAKEHLFLTEPFETSVAQNGDLFTVTFYEHLGKILNKAFPTRITLDKNGNIQTISHFYFEYEELGRSDIMSPQAALAALPRDHQGKIRITDVQISYTFINSILQPTYTFQGTNPDGTPFSHPIIALKSY